MLNTQTELDLQLPRVLDLWHTGISFSCQAAMLLTSLSFDNNIGNGIGNGNCGGITGNMLHGHYYVSL
ncbi:hypothetical protein ACLKA6_015148 [Drosophila palustris]